MGDCDMGSSSAGGPSVEVISGPAALNPHQEGEMDALLLGRTRELVTISLERKNWRGIFIALLVIAVVLSLIFFSIVLLSPEDDGARIKGRLLTLTDINGSSLKWHSFNGTWMNDFQLVYRDTTGGLSIFNANGGKTEVLMNNDAFRQLNADKFVVSPDLNFVLLQSETDKQGSIYHIYDVRTKNKFPLTVVGVREAVRLQHVIWMPIVRPRHSSITQLQQSVVASNGSSAVAGGAGSVGGPSPLTGRKMTIPFAIQSNVGAIGNSIDSPLIGGLTTSQGIAFVYENNLYLKPRVQDDLICEITRTGKSGTIYNAIPDWFYANTPELVSDTLAFSHDGYYLSFLSFNDTLVNEYRYSFIGENKKYPNTRTIRYPKAMTTNPRVTVFVYNLAVLKHVKLEAIILPARITQNDNCYVAGMIWTSSTELSITVTDRKQTNATTVLCRAPNFACEEVHIETIIDEGTVLLGEKPFFSKMHVTIQDDILNTTNVKALVRNSSSSFSWVPSSFEDAILEVGGGGYFLKRLLVRDGEHGYYRHVVLVSVSDMRTVPLTMGRYEVTEILGWDEANGAVYFMVAPENKPGERHLYRVYVNIKSTASSSRFLVTAFPPHCLTCDNSPRSYQLNMNTNSSDDGGNGRVPVFIPNNCLFNRIQLSTSFSSYVQECLGPDSPSVYLVNMHSNKKVAVLHDGEPLRTQLIAMALPHIKTFSVEIRHGFQAQVRLFLPPSMKDEEEVSYPLILQIDSAPGSQLVSEKFEVDWNWYLSSQRSMIVGQIDVRGSGFQGEQMRSQIKGNLGSVEIEDLLGVTTYLRDTFPFIDPTRICTYGSGYGGYASAMALADDSQRILQCAVAINPIVVFGYHSSFFTERFLRGDAVADVSRNLQMSDLTTRVANLNGRNFLLVHATGDTFVHNQHSLVLSRALIDADILFRQQVYTDADHDMAGVINHFYRTVEQYFEDSFGPMETDEWDPTALFPFKQ